MKKLKDSGVEFIGLIPCEWTVLRFKNLGSQRNGLTYKPTDIVGSDEGTLVLRSSNIKKGKIVYDDNVYVSTPIPASLRTKINDILICSRNGSRELIGKNALIDVNSQDKTFGAFMMLFRTKENAKYIYYVLNSPVFTYYLGTFFTSTINQLTGQNFENMKIPYSPSVAEQKAIADFLDKKCGEIDEISKIIEDQIETLENYKKSVVTEAATKGLNLNAKLKDSGFVWIGNIPDHWKVLKIKDGFTRKKGKALQQDPVVLSLARSGVKIRDISTNEGQLAASYYEYNPVDIDDMLLNPMDLQSGANCSISRVRGVISPAYVNLRYKKGFDPRFYDYYFKIQYWSFAFFSYGKGVSFDNRWTLNEDTLMRLPLIVPPLAEQKAIADFLDKKCGEIDEIIDSKRKQLEKIDQYKKSLIYEYVTGKREVIF